MNMRRHPFIPLIFIYSLAVLNVEDTAMNGIGKKVSDLREFIF